MRKFSQKPGFWSSKRDRRVGVEKPGFFEDLGSNAKIIAETRFLVYPRPPPDRSSPVLYGDIASGNGAIGPTKRKER
ncbi:MAG: hypothetical protein AB4352_10720 [Hormoscilla sp.]